MGTSHAKTALPCQDFALCNTLKTSAEQFLIAVVSDGAGTAKYARDGARITCLEFMYAAKSFLIDNPSVSHIEENTVLDWLDRMRDRLSEFSRRRSARPRDFAATLIGLIAGSHSTLIVHIGDGAAVVREDGKQNWIVPSWPYHGEYEATTCFVTDDPPLNLTVMQLPIRIDRFALFSDGIERLVLDFTQKNAYAAFFERITKPLESSKTCGFDFELANSLQSYLSGQSICDRTDDDKSLIIGIRV